MPRFFIMAAAATLLAGAAWADEPASAEETASVKAELAKIGCVAEEVEKEADDLYELDDVKCEIGQYDIKLNGEFKIKSMTIDE